MIDRTTTADSCTRSPDPDGARTMAPPDQDVTLPSIPLAPPPQPSLIYEQSSQARKWHFTQAQVDRMRQASNETSKAKVLKSWEREEVSFCCARAGSPS